MVRISTLLAALAATSTVLADTNCTLTSKCPESAPCCSQYGQCGVGAYCLGGCDPRSSFKLESCVPEPVCSSRKTTFDSLDKITSKTEYLGDSSKTDWVMDGNAVLYNNGEAVLLTMAEGTVGTLLASSTYMWYGSVEATFKTSQGAGVVTAFILLSDVKDEIDYEFVGVELETAQTNYYYQGIPNYDNSGNISLSNTFDNYHTYKIDWTPDSITWSVDGQVGRTKNRKDTWNATSNQWAYPQTPARVQLSLWPGGLSTNGQGTISWAGGPISFNAPESKPYYYAAFKSVTINCYNAKTAPGTNSGKSYTYNGYAGSNDTVVDGSGGTVLKSFLGTGTDMNAGDSTASGTGASASSTVGTVPGLEGGGVGGSTSQHSGDGSGDSSSSGSSSSVDSASGSASTSSGTSFSQGSSSSSSSSTSKNSGADKVGAQERVLGGSIFAGIIAVVAMMAL